MSRNGSPPLRGIGAARALRTIVEGTATETGERFFGALVESLALALGTDSAWVAEYLPDSGRLRVQALWRQGRHTEGFTYDIRGTACEAVLLEARPVHIPDRLLERFPEAAHLLRGAVSYLGMPLVDRSGRAVGLLAVFDSRPMPAEPVALTLFRILAARAAAEIERVRDLERRLEAERRIAVLTVEAEEARLRARLAEAERFAVLGELAAGVVHELRNPLAAIVNAAALLGDGEGMDDEERTAVGRVIRTEAHRLNGILSDFLTLGRVRPPRRAMADIRDVVDHVVRLVRDDRTRAGEVTTDVAVAPDVAPFAFDRDQLTQVLLNLALNGCDAMGGRGRLTLAVKRHAGRVRIRVADTGCGIAPEDRSRIFEPLFTRKAGGTGLGLAVVRRIVTAHGGRIVVESPPGSGTAFVVDLPTDAEPTSEAAD